MISVLSYQHAFISLYFHFPRSPFSRVFSSDRRFSSFLRVLFEQRCKDHQTWPWLVPLLVDLRCWMWPPMLLSLHPHRVHPASEAPMQPPRKCRVHHPLVQCLPWRVVVQWQLQQLPRNELVVNLGLPACQPVSSQLKTALLPAKLWTSPAAMRTCLWMRTPWFATASTCWLPTSWSQRLAMTIWQLLLTLLLSPPLAPTWTCAPPMTSPSLWMPWCTTLTLTMRRWRSPTQLCCSIATSSMAVAWCALSWPWPLETTRAWAMLSMARFTTSTSLLHSWGSMMDLPSTWRTCGAFLAVAPPTAVWWLAPSSSPSLVCSPSLSVRPATRSGREVTSSRTMSPRATRFSARWTSAFLRSWRPWELASRRLEAPSSSLPTSLQMTLRRWLLEASTSCPSSVLCLRTAPSWLMATWQVEQQWHAAGATSPSSSCTTTVLAMVQWQALRPSVATLPLCTPRSPGSLVPLASTLAPWASARWRAMPLTRTLPTCCRMTRLMVLTTVRSGRAWRRPPLSSPVAWTHFVCQHSSRIWDTPTWSWLLEASKRPNYIVP